MKNISLFFLMLFALSSAQAQNYFQIIQNGDNAYMDQVNMVSKLFYRHQGGSDLDSLKLLVHGRGVNESLIGDSLLASHVTSTIVKLSWLDSGMPISTLTMPVCLYGNDKVGVGLINVPDGDGILIEIYVGTSSCPWPTNINGQDIYMEVEAQAVYGTNRDTSWSSLLNLTGISPWGMDINPSNISYSNDTLEFDLTWQCNPYYFLDNGYINCPIGFDGQSWNYTIWTPSGSVHKKYPIHGALNNPVLCTFASSPYSCEYDHECRMASPLFTEDPTNNIGTDIVIYPNPANDIVHINNIDMSDSEVSIINMLGQKILVTENISEIDIASIPSGIYVVKIENKGSISAKVLQITR